LENFETYASVWSVPLAMRPYILGLLFALNISGCRSFEIQLSAIRSRHEQTGIFPSSSSIRSGVFNKHLRLKKHSVGKFRLRARKDNVSKDGKQRKKSPDLFLAARALLSQLKSIKSKFMGASRKIKIILTLQFTIIILLFGSVVNTAVSRKPSTVRPVEVPFSVFMDMAEANGKTATSRGNVGTMDNVVIGRDRLSFRLTPQHKTDSNGLSLAPRNAYTRKVSASPSLIQLLRENEIPFLAASTKANNAVATSARGFIFVIYLLFMVRMYRQMNGGGGGVPGKLASEGNDRTLVKFEDIEGIDKAKFEVMELVDTLRNPGKYAILGARAPTGLVSFFYCLPTISSNPNFNQ